MSFCLTGGVGAGKTFNTIRLVAESDPKQFPNVYTNIDIDIPGRNIIKWRKPSDLKNANCGYIVIDEADMYFNSRNFSHLDEDFRNLLKEHRKHHVRIIYTTQHVGFMDKVARIFIDEVWWVKSISLPLIGLIWSKSIRPDVICPICHKVRIDDGVGDASTWWKKFFGFGTLYYWKVYPMSLMRDEEDLKEIEEMENVKPRRTGFALFDKKYANMYSTSAKVSEVVAEHRRHAHA